MLRVGLTGGIATGKSHVLSVLHRLGCRIIDADQVARDVVVPGRPAYAEIVREFGHGIVTESGAIDRPQLGAIIFRDPPKRRRLNAIIHPRIMEEIERRLAAFEESDPEGMAVVDGALILEAGAQALFDRLIVVSCDPEEQVRRLMDRDRLSRQEAVSRIQAQMPTAEKRRYADFEIDTSGPFDQTDQQIERVYRTLHQEALASSQCSVERDPVVDPRA
jgi:dephospho-CoA kinase